jgi:hypothetical protein
MVLISDGQATGSALTTRPTPRPPPNRRRIASPDRSRNGRGRSQVNPRAGQSRPAYQSGTPGPISGTKLVADLGAAVAIPHQLHSDGGPGRELLRDGAEPEYTDGHDEPGTLQWTGT